MSRLVPALCAVSAIGVVVTVWSRLNASTIVTVPTASVPTASVPTASVPTVSVPTGSAATPTDRSGAAKTAGETPEQSLRTALHAARRTCALEPMAQVLTDIERHAEAHGDDAAAWRLLAEAHLERAQQHAHLRGLRVGEPVYAELPAALADDVRAGLAAVTKARELGDESGALCRIEAGLMSQQITGFGTALQWNGRIGRALELAASRAADDPQLHTALGLRKLLAPRWFGHDPAKALEHFEFAAKASDDERPAVFAAMATYLQKKRQQAIAWLEQAVARNPDNTFARVCLRRLRRGEDDPFGRDVTAEEVAAAK